MDSRWMANNTMAEVLIDLNPFEAFNKITLFEYKDKKNLRDGFSQIRNERIKEYSIDILEKGQWQTIYFNKESMVIAK